MKEADYVFEVSYEVCNKVGGIYAVLRSKAAQMVQQYGEGYTAVGYYDPVKSRVEFDAIKDVPPDIQSAIQEVESKGVKVYYGKWLIPGRPNTILVDAKGLLPKKDEIRTRLWKQYGVDSLGADGTFDDPVVWSTGVGMFLEALLKTQSYSGSKNVVHCHEWMSGQVMLYLVDKNVNSATVFTTHATMLGRSIAGSGDNLHEMVDAGLTEGEKISIDTAKKYGVKEKHTMELACASNTGVFTTVSEVTAREAEYILGRRPDVILPNGLDTGKFPEIEELSILRRKYRNVVREFLSAYFNRYYYTDFYNIRSFFLSGRYEYHNKGVDLFIEALGRLNERLKKEKVDKHAVAFIWVPTSIKGEKVRVLKNVSLMEEMNDYVERELPEIKDRILNKLVKGELPDKASDILSDECMQTFRKMMVHFLEHRGQTPPLCAFELTYDENQDSIIKALKSNGMLNREEDKVKIVYYPSYLSSADRLIALDYNQATMTCDMGVFPSYYEPWGYTPLETAAQASVALTTDLAGFGQFIKGKGNGIIVLERMNREWDRIVQDLADRMYEVTMMPRHQLAQLRINAKELSFLADWKFLVENYVQAHNLALEKTGK